MRALTIDDFSFIRRSLHSLLTARGIESVDAGTGDEGLETENNRRDAAVCAGPKQYIVKLVVDAGLIEKLRMPCSEGL